MLAAVFQVEVAFAPAVGVDDYFVGVEVAFARRHHVGAGVFEHRHQVWHHEALREKVFHRAEKSWPLPAPALVFLVVVFSVALPYGDYTVVEPLGDRHGAIEGYEAVGFVERPGSGGRRHHYLGCLWFGAFCAAALAARGVGIEGRQRHCSGESYGNYTVKIYV